VRSVLADEERTLGARRLAVLSALPAGHQRYLFEKVENLCADWLRRHRIVQREITPRELSSEIWLKLVSTLTPADDTTGFVQDLLIGAADPRNDERVIWLIAEVGGSQAIQHRYEDINRQRYGRGGRLRQREEDDTEEPQDEVPPYEGARHLQDVRDIWKGMLIVARQTFADADDVTLLLRLLAEEPELLDEAWGNQWPIQRIVELLSDRPPPRNWDQEQVDNAKRRLTGWIGRLMRKNGLDHVDLEALFAAVAKRSEAGEVRRSPSDIIN
jgi:hypothetical protein